MTDDEIAEACRQGQQHCRECRVVTCCDNLNEAEKARRRTATMTTPIKPRRKRVMREPRTVGEDVLALDSLVKNTDWIGCGEQPPPSPCRFALRGMRCDCLRCVQARTP